MVVSPSRPKRTRLGLFQNELDAAEAYNEAARALGHPESSVNFPIEGRKQFCTGVTVLQR